MEPFTHNDGNRDELIIQQKRDIEKEVSLQKHLHTIATMNREIMPNFNNCRSATQLPWSASSCHSPACMRNTVATRSSPPRSRICPKSTSSFAAPAPMAIVSSEPSPTPTWSTWSQTPVPTRSSKNWPRSPRRSSFSWDFPVLHWRTFTKRYV